MKIDKDDWWFQGLVRLANLIPNPPQKLKSTDTAPNISGVSIIQGSGSVVSITNFLGGSDGTTLSILGDGTTTVNNNTNIKTNTGANKLLASNKIYRFTYFNQTKLWIEDA